VDLAFVPDVYEVEARQFVNSAAAIDRVDTMDGRLTTGQDKWFRWFWLKPVQSKPFRPA